MLGVEQMPLPREVQDSLAELAQHYEIEGWLDRGANGYLFFARNIVSANEVAIKFYAGEAGDGRHDEPRLLAQVHSANVLRILDARSISPLWAYFITPRCEGDLDDYILAGPSTHEAIDVSLGVCSGASAIHASRMLHRDLKPGNIVIQGGTPLIADFGSVRLIPDGSDTVVVSRHSVLFRPPESFDTGTYSRQGDIYQIGLVVYLLLGGALPYDLLSYLNRRDQRALEEINDEVDRSLFIDQVIGRRATNGSLLDFSSLPPWVTGRTRGLIRRMTAPDPNRRLATLGETAAALTRCRQDLANWKSLGEGAQLNLGNRAIELRPTGIANRFEAVIVRDGISRRAPGVAPGSISELIRQLP